MAQTRFGSLHEALTNVAIGYGINLAANLAVLPAFGYRVTLSDAVGIGVVFTVISVVRSYTIRRLYERMGWFQKKG